MTKPDTNDDTYAQALDAADPLRGLRDEFLIPQHDGREQAYLCGNSLGLQPRTARAHVEEVLDKRAQEAVEGQFTGQEPWMHYPGLGTHGRGQGACGQRALGRETSRR